MKKLYIILAIVIACCVMIIPITAFMIRTGFKHQEKPWAAGLVYRGAAVRMRLQQFGSAQRVLARAVEVFPDYKDVPRAHYWLALCAEKSGNAKEAISGYNDFLGRWPKHPWASQANRRLSTLEAQNM